jgi:hypothetical protein
MMASLDYDHGGALQAEVQVFGNLRITSPTKETYRRTLRSHSPFKDGLITQVSHRQSTDSTEPTLYQPTWPEHCIPADDQSRSPALSQLFASPRFNNTEPRVR